MKVIELLALLFLVAVIVATITFTGMENQSLKVSCKGGPAQYQAAGCWLDAGTKVCCDENGQTGNLFYSDAIINK